MARNTNNKKIKYQDKPVYPTQFDTNAFPNRVYIQGVKSLVILLVFLLMVLSVLSIIYLHKIKSVSIMDMAFVYWDSVENTFKQKHIRQDYLKREKRVPAYEIVLGNFIDGYYDARYNVSNDIILNEKNWCQCEVNSLGQKADFEVDINLVKNCFVCSYSDNNVYGSFVNFHLPVLKKSFEDGEERNVVILDKQIIETSIRSSKGSDLLKEFITQILNFFTGAKEKVYFALSYTYKVDFALVKKTSSTTFSVEILTGYTSVVFDYDKRFFEFKVVEHGEMPNAYDDVLKVKYKNKISRYLN